MTFLEPSIEKGKFACYILHISIKDSELNSNKNYEGYLVDRIIDFINQIQDLDVNTPKHHKIDKNMVDEKIIMNRLEKVESFILSTFRNKNEPERHQVKNYTSLIKPTSDNLNLKELNIILNDKIHYLNKENQFLK